MRLGVRGSDQETLEVLRDALPGHWVGSSARSAPRVFTLLKAARGEYVLFRDDEEMVRSHDLERIHERLVGFVGFYLAERSGHRRTFIHAGAVGWKGHAILAPGAQGTGKTTLTAALVRAGASYLSDDFAPIDDRGRVDPFARPLSVRQAEGQSTRLERVEAVGGVQELRSLPVGLVVLAPFSGVRRWRPRRLSGGEAVLELLAHTVSAQTKPRQALERLGKVVVHATVLKGSRGDADETADAVLRRLGMHLARR